MHRQQIELDQMYDFIALRLVTDTVPHCYAALGVIHHSWRPIPGRIKDFIAMPRPNGYQSLHTSLLTDSGTHFEVQIRTADMHRVAEEGIAAHWDTSPRRSTANRMSSALPGFDRCSSGRRKSRILTSSSAA